MKKEWNGAKIEELNVQSTAQAPTDQVEFDLLFDGEFTVGRKISGPSEQIEFYPGN